MAVLDASATGVFSLVGIDCMWRWSCCYVISRGLMGWAALLLCVDKVVSQVFEPVTAAVFYAPSRCCSSRPIRLRMMCLRLHLSCGWVMWWWRRRTFFIQLRSPRQLLSSPSLTHPPSHHFILTSSTHIVLRTLHMR
jgi:hypothetical protein